MFQTMFCSSGKEERQFEEEKILELRGGKDLGDMSYRQ